MEMRENSWLRDYGPLLLTGVVVGVSALVLTACGGAGLEQPMRWSEDFGHYLRRCPGAFFGIGAGETCRPLHSTEYQYPRELLAPSVQAFINLLASYRGQ